jgi:hypothetical protein
MRNHLIGLSLIALLAATASAAPPFNGGFGCFGPTVGIADFSGLDDALANGFITEKLNPVQWGFGGAGFGVIDRVVIGGSGWGGSQTVGSGNLRATVKITGGEFDIGYQVFSLKNLLIAPMLGIGRGGYTIELQKLSSGPLTFGQLLADPGRTSTISYSRFTLSPQLMVTVPIAFAGVQLRGGYCYTPMNPEWELAGGGKLSSGPAISKGLPFVTFNVVFGGFEGGKRRSKK